MKIFLNSSVSDFESKEFVASSNIMTFGSEYKTLAIDILCFCPPLISGESSSIFLVNISLYETSKLFNPQIVNIFLNFLSNFEFLSFFLKAIF